MEVFRNIPNVASLRRSEPWVYVRGLNVSAFESLHLTKLDVSRDDELKKIPACMEVLELPLFEQARGS